MEIKDTKYIDLKTNLSAVGKAVFANFYYEFKDASISDDVLSEKLFRENPNSKSRSQNFRIPRARHIFKAGQQLVALQIIIDSDRVDPAAREKAQQILLQETKRTAIEQDVSYEHNFIEQLNKEIVYSETPEFEYNPIPQIPKASRSTIISAPARDRSVALNALKKANYQCEIDANHFVFRRKNGKTNYTEPHHLVPLNAQKDFPDADLDREQNIVSLCSNCHNWLHYGDEIDSLLINLCEKRKDLLKTIGVEITYEQLKAYYL